MVAFTFACGSRSKKCVVNGKTIFQDKPCPEETQVPWTPKTGGNGSGAQAPNESDSVIAATVVGSNSYLLESLVEWCSKKVPSSRSAVQEAKLLWLTRHEILVAKASRIVREKLTHDERVKLAANSKLEMKKIRDAMGDAGSNEHQNWCSELPVKIASPEFDLMGRPALVKAIMGSSHQ